MMIYQSIKRSVIERFIDYEEDRKLQALNFHEHRVTEFGFRADVLKYGKHE